MAPRAGHDAMARCREMGGLSQRRSAPRWRGGATALRPKCAVGAGVQKRCSVGQRQSRDGDRWCASAQAEHAIEMLVNGRIRRPRVLHRHTTRCAAHQRVLHRLHPGRGHRHAQRHAPPQQYPTRQGGGFAQGMQGHGAIMAARGLGNAHAKAPIDGTPFQHPAATSVYPRA